MFGDEKNFWNCTRSLIAQVLGSQKVNEWDQKFQSLSDELA